MRRLPVTPPSEPVISAPSTAASRRLVCPWPLASFRHFAQRLFCVGCITFLVLQWNLSPAVERIKRSSVITPSRAGSIAIAGAAQVPNDQQQPSSTPAAMVPSSTTDLSSSATTVILEYESLSVLTKQLRALVQQTLPAESIWVVSSCDPDSDGGDAAREHIASHSQAPSAIHLISVAHVLGDAGGNGASAKRPAGAANASVTADAASPNGAASAGRLVRFQLALQAPSRHVLVLDPSVTIPPRLLELLVHAAQLPDAHGVLGVAGWTAFAREEGTDETGGGAISRISTVDVLRGAWFLQVLWVPLLFREFRPAYSTRDPPFGSMAEGGEAWVSQMLWRHGDLPSMALPAIDASGGLVPQPTTAQEEAWRRVLREGVRRGDIPKPRAGSDSEHVHSDKAARIRPVVLLVVDSLLTARRLSGLYRALRADASHYDPRLVLAPRLQEQGGCEAVAVAMKGASASRMPDCSRAETAYSMRGNLAATPRRGYASGVDAATSRQTRRGVGGDTDGAGLAVSETAAATERAAACGALMIELESILLASSPTFVVLPSTPRGEHESVGGGDGGCSNGYFPQGADGAAAANDAATLEEAVRTATEVMGIVVVQPPIEQLDMLEFVSILPPSAMLRWQDPSIDVAVITHRRPQSLRRLLSSLRCSHYLGDRVDATFSLEAGGDKQTVDLARQWVWPHGTHRSFRREAEGGLVTAVVESWYPSTRHSYGLMLEDDIEVSPFFYVYLKALLLRHVYAVAEDADGGRSRGHDGGGAATTLASLLGVSLYTPRLVELTMPRRHIQLFTDLDESNGGGTPHLFAQQLPCSWGQLFFSNPWITFRKYMAQRLQKSYAEVLIPRSACCPGWSTSWKKFLIELSYLRGYVVLYPNFFNQTAFSTNHLEPGEHIGGKANKLKHKPIDFTVPLVDDFATLRAMWTNAVGQISELTPLERLPTLDLFSERTPQHLIVARGAKKLAEHPEITFRDA